MAGGSPEEMVNGGSPMPFDTSVAHVARVYNYWLGGSFLYTHTSHRVGVMQTLQGETA